MSLNVDDLFANMLEAGKAAFGAEWATVSKFVPAEFKKMAVQLVDVAENVAKFEANPDDGYPPAAAKVLIQMQRRSVEAALTAVAAITLVTVQNAINAILKILKDTFGGVLKDFL